MTSSCAYVVDNAAAAVVDVAVIVVVVVLVAIEDYCHCYCQSFLFAVLKRERKKVENWQLFLNKNYPKK